VHPSAGEARGDGRLQEWASSFVESTRDYVYVRLEDNVLILRPNRVQYLNKTAAVMLHALYDQDPVDVGALVRDMAERFDVDEPRVAGDLEKLLASLDLVLKDKSGCAPAVRSTLFGTHKHKFPVLSEIALTYRCQNRCFFCYASSPDRGRIVPEMSTDEVKQVIDKIVDEAHVPTVSFTGGEPTLREDLVALIRYARGRGMRANLITNGIRCADRGLVAALASAELNSAQVSLEAGDAATHDHVVGRPGAFEQTMAGIQNLKAAGIHTHTNTTINSENLDALHSLIDLLARMGQEYLSMNMVIRTGGAVGVPDISYTQIGDIVLDLRAKAEERGLRFVWYSPVPYCLLNPAAQGLGAQSCAAADGLLSVAPDGQVLPCSSFETGIGNLLNEDFATIWNRRAARYWRNKEFLPPGCKSCELVEICCGACPLYWDEQGTFAELTPFVGPTSAVERLAWRLRRRYVGQVKGVGVH
jgi:radical SAM protein with 4Fe4S-binding SPASM domain